jgi:hypothetical protein
MTDHVRTGYRNHRKTAWGLALLLVAAIATVTIPLASGAPSKTLQFVTQPPGALQKSTPATTASVAVAVFAGGPNAQNSQGQQPTLSATGAGTIDAFVIFGPTYDGNTNFWTWSVTPKSNADEGLYNFVATSGNLAPATSDTFRVAQFVCPPSGGPSCDATSDVNTGAQGEGKLKIANTLGSPIALDFQPGGALPPLGCNNASSSQTWNRAFYLDANQNPVYFPAVALNFTWGSQMLQITYMVRNSEWILTNAARGNNDVEFCAEARHQTAAWNGDGANPRPFAGKYGPAQWDGTNYSGVLTTVSNPSKVKTNGTGSPAVCGRGSVDISGETWRTWTICIPFDWDWGVKPG